MSNTLFKRPLIPLISPNMVQLSNQILDALGTHNGADGFPAVPQSSPQTSVQRILGPMNPWSHGYLNQPADVKHKNPWTGDSAPNIRNNCKIHQPTNQSHQNCQYNHPMRVISYSWR